MSDKIRIIPGTFGLVASITNTLVGLTMIEADKVLDDARRVAWLRVFSGASVEKIQGELKVSESALNICGLTEGMDLYELEQKFTDVRMNIWGQNYAQFPDTPFGRQYAEREGAQLYQSHDTVGSA